MKKEKIIELTIGDLDDSLGVDIMSLVDNPAIGVEWVAFSDIDSVGTTIDYSNTIYLDLDKDKFNSFTQELEAIIALDIVGKNEGELKYMFEGGNKYFTKEDVIKNSLSDVHPVMVYNTGDINVVLKQSFSDESIEIELIELINTPEFGESQDLYQDSDTASESTSNLITLADTPVERKYRYAGPSAERNFCKALLRANKVYSKADIARMSEVVNTGFRHNNSPYSILDYKGGVNCKHYWEAVDIYTNSAGNKVLANRGRADGKPGEIASESNNFWRFSAITEEERIVTGAFLIPNLPIKRLDSKGEVYHVYYSEDTVKKVAEKFLAESNHNNTDVNHSDKITNKNTLLESWIVEDSQKDKSALYGFNLPKGTWAGSYRINDDDTWQRIKNGELNGFSITGYFTPVG